MRIYDTCAFYIPDPAPGGCPASVNDEDLDETIAKIESSRGRLMGGRDQ